MDHFPFLWAAYTIVFAAIFLYVVFLWRRQSELESELKALESRVKELLDSRRADKSGG